VTLLCAADRQEFRVPIQIRATTSALFIKIILHQAFPVATPVIIIMAQVVHAFVKPESMEYIGPAIKSWTAQSNVVKLLQQITQEFDREAPIPMHLLVESNHKTMTGLSAQF
jgi:ubiquitin-protein ligase